jgi:hypothetical protein
MLSAPALATASPAELAIGEHQLQLQPRSSIFDEQLPESRYWRAVGFAQLVAGGSDGGGGLGAGGAVAVAGVGCDLVDAGGQLRLQPRGESPLEADARYAVCLSRLILTVAFDGRRGFGIAPGIADRSSLWRRHYDYAYDRLTIAFGELASSPHHRHTVLPIWIGHGSTEQTDGAEQRTIKQLDVGLALYRHRYVTADAQTSIDALALETSAMKAGSTDLGGVTSAFYPVKARIDTPRGWAFAHVGWGIAGGQLTASGSTSVNDTEVSSWSETIDSAGLPSFTTLAGAAGLGARWPERRLEASGSISRGLFPTFDGNLALEERLAGTGSLQLGRTDRPTVVTLSPFLTRTQTFTREAGRARDASVGASLHVGRDLSTLLRLDGIGELGVSPYARLDGNRAPASTLGGQVLVALSARRSR